MGDEWQSPDGKIKKVILVRGTGLTKPTESSECMINIFECNANNFNCKNRTFTIGDSFNEFESLLDNVLQKMHANEVAKVAFLTQNIEFTLELKEFISKGLIYEWGARFKYDLAFDHKTKGNDLFKLNKFIDASHRFSKGLKIICSIPIDVEAKSTTIDGILLTDINSMKAMLYNNLASCFLKVKNYERVVGLIEKVFLYDKCNVKAHYKNGVSCYELEDYDRALESFNYVLKNEPNNTSAIHYHSLVLCNIKEKSSKYNDIVKKMFQ